MPEFDSLTLRDPTSALTATYVPSAGMICTSLADAGVEFLGQRRGLDAYITSGKTMGIPLLYPWANRLSDTTYRVDGGLVSLSVGAGGVRADEHGLPIHGVLAAYSGWLVTETSDNSLTAVLDYASRPRLLAAFPFPHVLAQQITLANRTLTVETRVVATTAASVPLCFGYHPYFTIPGVPRREWVLTTPAMRRLPVDDRGIPTGATEDWSAVSGPLKAATYDDGFDQVPEGAVFALEGGGRRIEVRFEKGYPAAQLFAPGKEDLIAIEPMAAPTDALSRGDYRCAAAGTPETARFCITVTAS
jgi:galactose mutarotase-like enzyme